MAFDLDLDMGDFESHIMCVEWRCPKCAATVRAGDLEELKDYSVPAHLRSDECHGEQEAIRQAQERAMLRESGQSAVQ